MKYNYFMLAVFCFQLMHSSAPAKSESALPVCEPSCSSVITKRYHDAQTQTESTSDMKDIRAITACKTTDQMMCNFAKDQLSKLSQKAAQNDFDSILALKLFEYAMHANYIKGWDDGDRRVACKKLLDLKLVEVYAADSYQVDRTLRKALIAEGIYSSACDQRTIARKDAEISYQQAEYWKNAQLQLYSEQDQDNEQDCDGESR